MKLTTLMIASLLFPSLVLADDPKGKAIEDKMLQGVNVNLGGGFYFSTKDKTENPHNCNKTYWYKLADKEFAKEAFLLISSAYNNKQSISFYIDGCNGDYPNVEYVYVGRYQQQ